MIGGDLNVQFNFLEEYRSDENNKRKYKTFDDFLKGKREELSSELEELRKERIKKEGGDLLKRCALVQKLRAIEDYLQPKDIRNYFSENQIVYVDKSFYYGM